MDLWEKKEPAGMEGGGGEEAVKLRMEGSDKLRYEKDRCSKER